MKEGDSMNYHFIGIKGAGMSALAVILKKLGNVVSGSDLEKHFFTEVGLIENNIPFYGYNSGNIKEDMVIIKGASISNDNVELVEAKRKCLKIYEYNEMVGELTKQFKTICVAGCHGKTTTTAMMTCAFGGIDGINYLIGDGTGDASLDNEFFVLESCEYKRHFLTYQPYYAIITNIDLDHVDYFKDIDDVIEAYVSYANNSLKRIVMWGDDNYLYKFKQKLEKPLFTYGLTDVNDLRAINVEYKSDGISFDILEYGHFDLPIYGEHQLLDALAVISVCYLEGIKAELVNENLGKFSGAKRRFSETVISNNIIIDDYAHHPNEVRATLNAVRQKYPDKKIVAIFQPHTYTRTCEFANDLVEVFREVDASYILDIHPAREKQEDYPDITSNLIINKLDNCYHIKMDEPEKLAGYNNCVFVFMSPNDVSKLEDGLKDILKG